MIEGNFNIQSQSLHCFTLLYNLHLFQVISYCNLGHLDLSHYSTVHSVVTGSTIYNLNRPLFNVLTTSPFPKASVLWREDYVCLHTRAKLYPHTYVCTTPKTKNLLQWKSATCQFWSFHRLDLKIIVGSIAKKILDTKNCYVCYLLTAKT